MWEGFAEKTFQNSYIIPPTPTPAVATHTHHLTPEYLAARLSSEGSIDAIMQYRIAFKKPQTQSQQPSNQELTSTEDSNAGGGSIYSDVNLQSQYLNSDDSVCLKLESIFSQTYNAIVYHTLRDQSETSNKEVVVDESGFSVKIANVDERSRLELLSAANVCDKNGEGLVRGECLVNILGVTPGGRLVQLNDAPLVASWEPVLPYQPHTAENFVLRELIEHFQACFPKYYKAA